MEDGQPEACPPATTSYERPKSPCSRIADDNSPFGLSVVLSFNPVSAGAIARTNCARVFACADNRHRRGHDWNCRSRAHGSPESALREDSRQSFVRIGYQSGGLLRAATRERG